MLFEETGEVIGNLSLVHNDVGVVSIRSIVAGKLFSLSNAVLDIRKCDNMIGWTLERYTQNTRVENQFYIYSGVTRHSQRNSGASVIF